MSRKVLNLIGMQTLHRDSQSCWVAELQALYLAYDQCIDIEKEPTLLITRLVR